MFAEEIPHQPGDLGAVGLQGEVPGIEEMEVDGLQVTPVGLSSGRREDLIVLAPDDQHRRLALAEIRLPLRVERRVRIS